MDILLDNPLATMYGPYFLLLYGFVTLFTILFFALFKTRIDQSDRLPVPSVPATIDPYEIAYLRGGVNELARTAVFSLMQKGLIEIKNEGKVSVITRTAASTQQRTNAIEDATLNWFGTFRDPKDLFSPGALTYLLEPYAEDYQRRLGRQQLIASTELKKRLSTWKWLALGLVLLLGGYKAVAAIAHGHFNLLGSAIIGVIGAVAIFLIARLPWLTKLGRAYLDRLQMAFEGLRYKDNRDKIGVPDVQNPEVAGYAAFDPLLLSVGIFGGTVLAGTAYGAYNDAFMRSQKEQAMGAHAGCGAGCASSGGGSCSSGSSCGSSGCSSGCGGGGCGGCGGS